MQDILTVQKPANPLPLVFDSPHSGTVYPVDFGYACPFYELEKAEDKYVDDLFSSAPIQGGSMLCALFPRSYIDPNRAVDDIDPQVLSSPWPFGPVQPTARSDAGIGLIRRIVRPGVPVYDRALTPEEIQHRIETCYHPYHDALNRLIEEAHYNFGQVWHINCHSMPASSARPKRAIGLIGNIPKATDFVIGDRDGTSADIVFTHALRDFLRSLGYTVTINDPFKGVEIIHTHSNPARGRHSIQIEVNKGLYMNEETGEKSENFDALRADIDRLINFCAEFVQSQLINLAAD